MPRGWHWRLSGNHGHALAGFFDDDLDDADVLLDRDRGRFAGGSHRNESVDARANLLVDQAAQGLLVDRVAAKRRDQCCDDSLEHRREPSTSRPRGSAGSGNLGRRAGRLAASGPRVREGERVRVRYAEGGMRAADRSQQTAAPCSLTLTRAAAASRDPAYPRSRVSYCYSPVASVVRTCAPAPTGWEVSTMTASPASRPWVMTASAAVDPPPPRCAPRPDPWAPPARPGRLHRCADRAEAGSRNCVGKTRRSRRTI